MFKETIFLILTLLRMRSWRQILILPIAAFSLLGIPLCHSLSRDWISKYLSQEITSSHRMQVPKIGCDEVRFKTHCALTQAFLREYRQQKNFVSLTNCATINTCFRHVYHSMFFMYNYKKSPLNYVDFKYSQTICQLFNGNILDCTFTAAVAALAKYSRNKREDWFHAFRTFQQIGLPISDTKLNPFVCNMEMSVFQQMPKAIMFQMMLLTAMVSIYTLLATVSCIHELKCRGFLQLMMRKGLLPFAYWVSVWILVTLEIVVFSFCVAASFYLLCPGFFTFRQILYSSLVIAINLLCTNAIVMLLTVLSNNYYTITKWVLLYMAATIFSILGNRLVHEYEDVIRFKYLRICLLLLPWANVAEQMYANLSGKLVGVNYYTIGLIVSSAAILVLSILTLYLDNVLSTGNDMCYPWSHPFRYVPSDKSLPDAVAPSLLVEFPEEPAVFVRIVGISPSQKTLKRGSISVDFYNEQITAIYCEDTERNTWLLSALTGRVHANEGTVWVNGCISSEPMSRLHDHTRLGECLQKDSLCHSLTVQYTLKMACVFSGTSWVEPEMNILLTLLRLSDTLNTTVGSLSPSQRRKLCIALALIGNPKLIILNDPTRGLDPLSRLRFWHLLQLYRSGRCIIVSTQFIDETDRFADKKVFLSPTDNFVLLSGSSKFVRQIAQSDLVLRLTLESEDKSETLVKVCQKNMPRGGEISLDKDQLSIFLTKDAESAIPGLIRALRSVEKYILTVGLHHAQLSGVYDRFKGRRFNSAKSSIVSARVTELLRPGSGAHVSMNSINYKQAESNRKSQKTFIGAMCGIFLFQLTLLYRERVKSVNRIILIVLLLVIHGSMHAIETKVARAGSTVWSNTTNMQRFTRGVCIGDENAAPQSKIHDQSCSIFFTGATSVKNSFISFLKPVTIDLNTFLLQPKQKTILYNHCNKTLKEELPCPIVYSSNWFKGALNHHREVAVGSFSRSYQYDPQNSIVSMHTAYTTTLAYFLKVRPTVKFDVLFFIDFRNYQLKIYGVYSQMFIFTVLPVLFLEDIVEHKTSKWRSYLASVGVSDLSYWAGILPVHWLQCLVAYGLCICISIAINPSVFLAFYQPIVFGLTSLGLANNLMLAYLFSLFVPISRHAFPLIYLLASVCTIVVFLFVQNTGLISDIAITAWPPFSSAALTYNSVKTYLYAISLNSIEKKVSLPKLKTFLGQSKFLIVIPVQTAVLAIMLFVMAVLRPRMKDCRNCVSQRSEDEDKYVNVKNPDVVLGDQCASIVATGECPIVLDQLKKSYANGIEAVRSLTLGVESNYFVAIVGPNASGLTTIVNTILGKTPPTKGKSQVQVDGVCATGSKIATSELIAYAPQWDPLFAAVTVEEHLRYYARVEGASAEMALQLLEDADLMAWKNEPAGQLTHGQRRRLCMAISLLSCSPLLLIDDASTGMSSDEVAQLWQILSKNFNRYSSGVLTAHSLAGAEAIGCRVAIINQGLMDFWGTLEQFQQQHRRHVIELEFDTGTETENSEKKTSLLQAVFQRFFSASVLDQANTWVKVFIPFQSQDLQFEALMWLLRLKKYHNLIDLTFYPATLDQTFEFVCKNHEAEVQRQSEALVNPDAAPLSCFLESYDI